MNVLPRLLLAGPWTDFPPLGDRDGAWSTDRVASLAEALSALAGDGACDAVLLDASTERLDADAIAAVATRAALVVVVPAFGDDEPDAALRWLRHGADDVLDRGELDSLAGRRRIRYAVERHRARHLDDEAGASGHATDTATGLAHRRQFIEHLSQLLALRERDPSPMAVVALRLEWPQGLDHADTALVRRKAAVRLRAAVRASDVVAATSADSFCVLLGTLLDPSDATAVAAKLAEALTRSYALMATQARVAVATGVAGYPRDGQDADRLLRRALSLAAAAPALAANQSTMAADALGMPRDAANADKAAPGGADNAG